MNAERKAAFELRGLMLDPARLTERHEYYFELLPHLADWGYNTLWWHFCDDEGLALELECYPDLASPYALTRRETADFIEAAAEEGIDVVPEVETLGHSLWITGKQRFSHLFDGMPYGHNAICPSHPETMEILGPIIEEVAELFPGRFFHAGLDEAVFSGCPRCSRRGEGRPEWWVFAEHVKAVYEAVKSAGKEMIMWADGMEKHPDLLGEFPRDIVMAHWHYGDIPEEKIAPTVEAGFRIVCVPAIQTVIQPARKNMENINGMIDLASRLSNRGCTGMVATWWEPFRVLRDAVFPAIAVTGKAMGKGRPADWQRDVTGFAGRFFGIADEEAAGALWETLSHTITREEFLYLYADSAADLFDSILLASGTGFGKRLAETEDALKALQSARSEVNKNHAIFDSLLLAARITAVALKNASRLREAFGYYRESERAVGYAGPHEDLLEKLEKASGLLADIRDDVSAVTADTEAEWDRTRYSKDPKKDNSSPEMRQRSRKALLGNMMRSRQYYRKLAEKIQKDIERFGAGGPFPGGL